MRKGRDRAVPAHITNSIGRKGATLRGEASGKRVYLFLCKQSGRQKLCRSYGMTRRLLSPRGTLIGGLKFFPQPVRCAQIKYCVILIHGYLIRS
jgi:hypothetical protein